MAREGGAYGYKGGAHSREGVRTSKARARMGGEEDAYGREGGCARVMGRARTRGNGGAHYNSLHQF
jgi:hypothetical protein